MLANITLPTLSDINDKQNNQKIMGYLATLHDQLRYMMLNIDTENLSEGLNKTIDTASSDAQTAKKEVESVKESIISIDESLSAVTQTAYKINWLIADGESATDFTLTSNAVSLISEELDIQSTVKFTDLKEQGKTVINGANITSGSITADKLLVSDLSALSATVGGWTVGDDNICSQADGSGALYINSAKSSDSCWIKAVSPYGYTTFYVAKDGSCYFDGSYIGGGSITADKISCDNEYRLDLTNNYNGIKIGSDMVISNGISNCKIYVNNSGILTFDTGVGESRFSLALRRSGDTYSFDVLNGSGNVVGNIPILS